MRMTRLGEAAVSGDCDLVWKILEEGADPDERMPGHVGMTAVMVAALHGNVEAALLLSKASDMSMRDGDGRTALHAAVWGGNECLVREFAGVCDPDARDPQGNTALMMALSRTPKGVEGSSWEGCLHAMAQRGGWSTRNENGRSAADMARESGLGAMAAMLDSRAMEGGVGCAPALSRKAPGV